MTQTLSPVDQFLHDYNTHVVPLTISEKCHLLGVIAIQMEWDQDHPCDEYSLADARTDHPFLVPATQSANAFLNGLSPKELATWMLEITGTILDETPESPLDVDRFSQEYNDRAFDLTIPEKCHLLALLSIQVGWTQANPGYSYTLVQAAEDHPFFEPATYHAITLLEGKSLYELATWMVELSAAIEDELPAE